MVSIMRKSHLIEPLDMRYVPNFQYVDAQFQHAVYDDPDENSGRRYSTPYQWGTTGYAVRTDKVDRDSVGAWSDLWDPRYKGQIQMLNDERETPGAALMKVGFEQTGTAWSVNTTDQDQLDQAKRALIKQKPLVRAYDSVNMKRALVNGVPLVHCWSGDALMAIDFMQKRRATDVAVSSVSLDPSFEPPIDYVLPSEGFSLWTDCMVIPNGFRSKYGAHLFMDYLLDPQVQGRQSNYTRYLPATGEASRPYVDAELYRFAPAPEDMARGQSYDDVGEFSRKYTDAWAKVKSS
jgi:spermidine/putrescine transport system substrate-binding protein